MNYRDAKIPVCRTDSPSKKLNTHRPPVVHLNRKSEKSSGANLSWRGLLAWVELGEDMIVVSAQLIDWHEKSARQSLELTEYFIENFSVDY